MHYPYQCLQICGNVLVAASTSHLDTFNLADRVHLDSWGYSSDTNRDESSDPSAILEPHDLESSTIKTRHGSEPLAKKLKISDENAFEVANSVENTPVSDQGRKSLHHQIFTPNIIALTATKDGRHVIAVTGEDKSIIVLENDGNGHLRSVNRRAMPKRPCAITLTTDDSTIICADKFGDVYSLPLLLDSSSLLSESRSFESKLDATEPMQRKPFVSAANNLTIHTARNRRALQNQLRQDQKLSEKVELAFEHQLLLGHVSMLTNIRVAEHGGCNYIITSDRDEHIRVSRGIPQAHIVESYCLGHKEFITELCLPTTFPNLLLSGGGDDSLYTWDWLQGQLLGKTHLRIIIEAAMKPSPKRDGYKKVDSTYSDPEAMNIAVSGIHHLVTQSGEDIDDIIVTCEGVPALLFFHLLESGLLTHYYTLELNGNPLSTVVDAPTGRLFVSVDCVHEHGSRTKIRANGHPPIERLRVIQKQGSTWSESRFDTSSEETAIGNKVTKDDLHNLTNLLYSLENLRKRSGEDSN